MDKIYDLTGDHPGFVLEYTDKKGVISKVSYILADHDINIASMKVTRNGDISTMICEVDTPLEERTIKEISELVEIAWARFFDAKKDILE